MEIPDVFTLSQAEALGVRRADVRRLVQSGWCRRLPHGGYVRADLYDQAGAAGQHVLAVRGRLLHAPVGAVAAHWSACVVHGLDMLGRPPSVPVITHSGTGSSRNRFVKVATLPRTEVTSVGPVPVTTLDRTIVDVSRRASFRSAVVVADAALRQGLTPSVLHATAVRWSRWPYGSRATRVAAFADGRAESPLESLGRVALHEHGVDPPELQVEVWLGGRLMARVDHLWEQHGVVGEADGLSKYDDPGALRAEKLRQEVLEQLGFVVVRYGWDDAYRRPAILADRFRGAFARGTASVAPGVRLVRRGPLCVAA